MPSPVREPEMDDDTTAVVPTGGMDAPMQVRRSSAAAEGSRSVFPAPAPIHRQQQQQQRPPAADETQQSSSLSAAAPALSSSSSSPLDPAKQPSTSGGWLMTSCDAADNNGDGPQTSLSEELKRLQLIRSYHAKDPERDACLDRFTSMACRVFQTPVALVAFLDMGRLMFRCNPEAPPDHHAPVSRTLRSCSQALQQHSPDVFVVCDAAAADSRTTITTPGGSNNSDAIHCTLQQPPTPGGTTHNDNPGSIPDMNNDISDGNPNATTHNNPKPPPPPPPPSQLQYRFLAGAPLISSEGCRLGAFCILDREPRPMGLSAELQSNLADYAQLALKTIVDRRRIATQANPSHLVACTAHDLITPLTGIQLSLSLLQQDTEFQQKLGDEQTKSIAAAVRSSNMMLRICQSTIETLRGHRNISIGNHWTIPRNLIQPQSSPFVDLKDFVKNLESISSCIPKRVPLTITIDPAAPVSVVTDGLKIFRSSLNLLSNACSKTKHGYIQFRIFDSGQRTLLFECEDTGKSIHSKNSESLFQQDGESSDLGLYSLASQISWLGGKYGYRPRCPAHRDDVAAGSPTNTTAMAEAPSNNNRDIPTTNSKDNNNNKPKVDTDNDNNQGSIFWFSIPLVLPQDVSDLMGLATQFAENGDEEARPPPSKEDMPLTPPTTPLADEYQSTSTMNALEGANGSQDDQKPKSDRPIKALIIEDSSVIRKILAKALAKYGYEVVQAVNGMEGLEELKKSMFDMVLCDFLMPVMDGLDCVSQYREWEKRSRPYFHQHIVGISAHANQKDIDRGLEIGMDDFKPKPILPKMLAQLHESPAFLRVRATLDKLASSKQRQLLRRRRQTSSIDMTAEGAQAMISKNSFHEVLPNPNNIILVDGKADRDDRPAKRSKMEEKIGMQVRNAVEKSNES